MKKLLATAAVAVLAVAAPAFAGELSVTGGVTSNYVYQGLRQSNGQPAYSLGLEYSENGFYVGSFGSNMDFLDGAKREVDFDGGYRTTVKGFSVDLNGTAQTYYGGHNARNWNSEQFGATVTRQFGPLNLGTQVAWTPNWYNGYGQGVWAQGLATLNLTKRLSISAAGGREFLHDGWSYSTYNVGPTFNISPTWTVDARWSDTDRHDLGEMYRGDWSISMHKTFVLKL